VLVEGGGSGQLVVGRRDVGWGGGRLRSERGGEGRMGKF